MPGALQEDGTDHGDGQEQLGELRRGDRDRRLHVSGSSDLIVVCDAINALPGRRAPPTVAAMSCMFCSAFFIRIRRGRPLAR